MKHLARELIVKPGSKIKLDKLDPDDTFGYDKKDSAELLTKNIERLCELQYRLYAEGRRSLLVVLQGIDAGGKDGTIKHVMTGMNPQGVDVTSFKVPEGAEKRHDYLWRVHNAVPEWGKMGIFNRSHYEDVLVVRVHDLVPKKVWSERYEQINDFERMLSACGVHIVKFLLYISKGEQEKRFRDRIEDKQKNWKFSPADVKERGYWDQYIEAYQEMLRKCSKHHAPWYVIPANNKWFRNFAVSQILGDKLESMDLKFPKPAAGLKGIKFE
jgi:PPK2 family polyphosphate:nucleotide phosphotransferase